MKMTEWITSDTHINHKNICRGVSTWDSLDGCRDFDTIEEMNDVIIDNINSLVKPDDTLYHLGDFAFGDKKLIPQHRARIKCKTIHLFWGNHDSAIKKDYRDLFTTTRYYDEIHVDKTRVCLFHFPIASWHKIGRGAVHLHGHCHGSFSPVGRCMDVGVDVHDFKPLKLQDAVAQCRATDIYSPDHHQGQE